MMNRLYRCVWACLPTCTSTSAYLVAKDLPAGNILSLYYAKTVTRTPNAVDESKQCIFASRVSNQVQYEHLPQLPDTSSLAHGKFGNAKRPVLLLMVQVDFGIQVQVALSHPVAFARAVLRPMRAVNGNNKLG